MNDIDFKEIPKDWALCQNGNCPKAGECLRHLACVQAPACVKKWECVLPSAINEEECHFFQSAEKVTMARGLNSIYRDVDSKKVRSDIRLKLTALFGSKGTYYRYKDGERTMTPQMQQQVADIVHLCAPTAEVSFDETFETYDFSTIQ
jgi:hypothetical protein